jgi:hypothetical protein
MIGERFEWTNNCGPVQELQSAAAVSNAATKPSVNGRSHRCYTD